MKKKLLISICFLSGIIQFLKAQNFSGQILDEQNMPMPFANIILLNAQDSLFLGGAVSNEEGYFDVKNPDIDWGIIKISSIGYKTYFQKCKPGDLGVIRLLENSALLNEVTIKGDLPTHKISAEGIQTTVVGTVLGKLGTAEDVLMSLPGLQKDDETYNVFGKGTPTIYIDGREILDLSELDQMKSDEIKNVELITNPGAKYDATVRAVIKIQTVRKAGDGFGFTVSSRYFQSVNIDLREELNWNYRYNDLDLFGFFGYSKNENQNESWMTQNTVVDTIWRQENYQLHQSESQVLTNRVGGNYAINDKNSVGATYTLKLSPEAHSNTIFDSELYANEVFIDSLKSRISGTSIFRPNHLVNAYYQGKVGEVNIDLNTTYLFNKNEARTLTEEESKNMDDQTVTTMGLERNQLFATKLVIGIPLWKGKMNVGAEYTQTKRKDDYFNNTSIIPNVISLLKEKNMSPFVEYQLTTKLGIMAAGVRYEYVDFKYYEDGILLDEESKTYANLFPSLTWSGQIKKLQFQASYTAKTRRPSYQQLSNNVVYGNRFTLQSGNPLLKQQITHDVSLMGMWKFLQAGVTYNKVKDAIIFSSSPLENTTSVTLTSYKNIDHIDKLTANIGLAPKIGLWSPQLFLGLNKQWLKIQTVKGIESLDDPIVFGSFKNNLSFQHDWILSVSMNYTSKGDTDNISLTENVFYMNASLQKSFLDNQLTLGVGVSDIFKGRKNPNFIHSYQTNFHQVAYHDSQEVYVTAKYSFNTTRSKYKGKGAGSREINRL